MAEANQTSDDIQTQMNKEHGEAPQNPLVTEKEKEAAREMLRKTEEQMKIREERLAEAKRLAAETDAQRVEMLKSAKAQQEFRDARFQQAMEPTPPAPPTNIPPSDGGNDGPSDEGNNRGDLSPEYVTELSEPQWDAPYDMIPLPSEGKLYKGVGPKIKVAYLNASDENLLTSPHILDSDYFLEILLNRKILDKNLRYKDLHVGDRNAIMVWLRATAYGTLYPITLLDELGAPFETEFDLATLKSKKLGANPDEEGLFTFKFPSNNSVVKFKLLTTNDIDELEVVLEHEKEVLKLPVNNAVTYTLQRHIVEINNVRDSDKIKKSIDYMRSVDRKAFIEYIKEVESGMDLNIEVATPRGGSITTLLPLNLNFFWPDYGV
jgi:hypothetical protein